MNDTKSRTGKVRGGWLSRVYGLSQRSPAGVRVQLGNDSIFNVASHKTATATESAKATEVYSISHMPHSDVSCFLVAAAFIAAALVSCGKCLCTLMWHCSPHTHTYTHLGILQLLRHSKIAKQCKLCSLNVWNAECIIHICMHSAQWQQHRIKKMY